MKIMILGITGLIGQALFKELKEAYYIIGLSRNCTLEDNKLIHESYDIEKESILPLLYKHQPDLLISCVRGEFNKQLEVHKEIVSYAFCSGMAVDFYSTANVFDGCPDGIKTEKDIPCSESDYGQYKIECEVLIKTLQEKARIIRLPMVFGETSQRLNLIKISLLQNEKIDVYDKCMLSIVTDKRVATLHHYLINNDFTGVVHFAAKGILSQEKIYKEIMGGEDLLNVLPLEVYYLAIQSTLAFINTNTIDEVIEELRGYIGDIHG